MAEIFQSGLRFDALSLARAEARFEDNLQLWLGAIDGPRACPAGATELSPGFQPWEPS
jgi:hypothetical protein